MSRNGIAYRRSAFSLVEMVVVVAVLAIVAAIVLPRYLGGKDAAGRKIRAPITMANDTVCQSNLRSVRQSLQAAQAADPDGKPVQSLTELRELTADLRKCPVGGEPYQYDPQNGQVRCPHPGHESY